MNYAPLSDRELLGMLIGNRAAAKVYSGKLTPLFCNEGTGPEKCSVAKELVKRWLNEEMKRESALSSPNAVRDFLRLHFNGREYESFVGIFLDAQNRVISTEELFRGTLTQTSVYPREVVKAALRENAAAVIFAHNHPSGTPDPSSADKVLTQGLVNSLALVDARVLDHFIIAGPNIMSFAERGLL